MTTPEVPDADKETGRVIALIVLLILTAAALRGYVPVAERTSGEERTASPGLTAVAGLLAVSLAIVALAVINRMRNPPVDPSSFGALSAGLGGWRAGNLRPTRRALLIGLGVIFGSLLIMALLMQVLGRYQIGLVETPPGAHHPAPGTDTAAPPPGVAPKPEQPRDESDGGVLGYLAATAAGMLILIAASAVAAGRNRRKISKPAAFDDEYRRPTAAATEPESLVRAAELGLAEIGDLSRGPREAIIGCYATMERQLAHVPDAEPQDFDTPSEVLGRAVAHHALTADNASQLVNLFAEARFSPHLMTERDRQDAVQVLRLVLDELQSRA